MRPVFLALALALTAGAFADNLINIPLGRKVPMGVIRFESRFQQSDFKQFRGLIDYGINTDFDARLSYEDSDGRRRIVTGDFAYNYITPLQGIAPGLSFGVLDVANRTQDGRRFYFSSTYRIDGGDPFNPIELTLGASFARRPIGFVGVSFPFTEQFRLLAEDDGRRISAGFEWRQSQSLAFRWLVQDERPLLSIRWQTHL